MESRRAGRAGPIRGRDELYPGSETHSATSNENAVCVGQHLGFVPASGHHGVEPERPDPDHPAQGKQYDYVFHANSVAREVMR